MKIFTVKDIMGEYATLVDDGGEELFIALALLVTSMFLFVKTSPFIYFNF